MVREELLRDPSKWQAQSVEPFVSLTPDKIFESDFSQQYIRMHDELWKKMERLHTTLVTLEQLQAFPFDLIYAPHEMDFWAITFESLFDTAFILLHSLLKDPKKDECSLRSLSAYILQSPWRDPDLREKFQCDIAKAKRMSPYQRDVLKRVATVRNKHISHHIFSLSDPTTRPQVEISLKEALELFCWAHTYFGMTSFGGAYCTLANDSMPTSRGRGIARTCLDKVLDGVLRDSHFVNRPGQRAGWWKSERQMMNEEVIQRMNELWHRVGMPEA